MAKGNSVPAPAVIPMQPQQKNVEEMTVTELEALGWQQRKLLDQAQQNLQIIVQELAKRG